MSGTKIVCCYAREDQPLLLKLKEQLSPLQRVGNIAFWADIDISPGTQWESELHTRLDEAQIILLLVSASFIASDYCYNKEMQRALQRVEKGISLTKQAFLSALHPLQRFA